MVEEYFGSEFEAAADAARRERMRVGLAMLKRRWYMMATGLMLGGALGYGASFLLKPRFMSSVLFIPPQQQGSSSSALTQLSALSGLVGGTGLKNPADQYISMMQGVTISDHIIAKFGLSAIYATKYKDETRKMLAQRVAISAGKKDGLIRIDVEDTDPKRAAAMANQYVDELRDMTAHLALTEAQQRRVFFERLLNDTKQRLIASQIAVEGSGFNAGALKAEPRSAAEAYAKLHADLTAAQVKLQVLRGRLADTSAEVVTQSNLVKALSDQVSRLEATQAADQNSPDYISKYRDFKYQETLFDLYSKQYELARLDESREGTMIQVVDEAQPAERKMFPRRSVFAGVAGVLFALIIAASLWRRARGATTS